MFLIALSLHFLFFTSKTTPDPSQDHQSKTARKVVSGSDSTSTWAALGDNMLECDSYRKEHIDLQTKKR